MSPAQPALTRASRYALWVGVCVQAALLSPALDLLPVWGDEHFTLNAASRPIWALLRTIAGEQNNPPLHTLLLHAWMRLPWPVSPLAAARALSVLLALAATVVIDRLWLKDLAPKARLWFLLLWTLSPCLLLYARIGRSYSLQVLLFAVALRLVVDLRRRPTGWERITGCAVAIAALVYTHYLPGLALLGACIIVFAADAWRNRKREPVIAAASVVAGVAVLCSVWLPFLGGALWRMLHAPPAATGGYTVDFVRMAYLAFSFLCGETPPTWVLGAGAIVGPVALWLAWVGLRSRADWVAPAALAAVLAFIGAGRWVSFIFVPARLLFLLPFLLILVARGASVKRRAGPVVCIGLSLMSAGSAAGYFAKSGFLNKGYLLPYQEIAEAILRSHAGDRSVLLADACNTDPAPLAALVGNKVSVLVVGRESTPEDVRRKLAAADAGVIWAFRNTHDTSPGGLNRTVEDELARTWQVRRHLYVPYDERDRLFMRLLGWSERPSHFVQLLEFRRPS